MSNFSVSEHHKMRKLLDPNLPCHLSLMFTMNSCHPKPDRLQLLDQLGPHGHHLGAAEAPVRVEEDEVGLLGAAGDHCVGVRLVGDALLVEDVLPRIP